MARRSMPSDIFWNEKVPCSVCGKMLARRRIVGGSCGYCRSGKVVCARCGSHRDKKYIHGDGVCFHCRPNKKQKSDYKKRQSRFGKRSFTEGQNIERMFKTRKRICVCCGQYATMTRPGRCNGGSGRYKKRLPHCLDCERTAKAAGGLVCSKCGNIYGKGLFSRKPVSSQCDLCFATTSKFRKRIKSIVCGQSKSRCKVCGGRYIAQTSRGVHSATNLDGCCSIRCFCISKLKRRLVINRYSMCIGCGAFFLMSNNTQKFCSSYCKDKSRSKDVKRRIRQNTRQRLIKAAKASYQRPQGTMRYVGCRVSELMAHLESLFVDGMSWDNYGEWHIDHIIPISRFGDTDEELEQAFNWRNTQPLWAEENVEKSDRIVYRTDGLLF